MPEQVPIRLRYESSSETETRYILVLEEIKVMRVYVDNLTRTVSISRGDVDTPTHLIPVEAVMTEEPDSSERGDRTGLRVKGTMLANQLMPALTLMLIALAANDTIGQVYAVDKLPVVTDENLAKFLLD